MKEPVGLWQCRCLKAIFLECKLNRGDQIALWYMELSVVTRHRVAIRDDDHGWGESSVAQLRDHRRTDAGHIDNDVGTGLRRTKPF